MATSRLKIHEKSKLLVRKHFLLVIQPMNFSDLFRKFTENAPKIEAKWLALGSSIRNIQEKSRHFPIPGSPLWHDGRPGIHRFHLREVGI
jgi:hypothetical protein